MVDCCDEYFFIDIDWFLSKNRFLERFFLALSLYDGDIINQRFVTTDWLLSHQFFFILIPWTATNRCCKTRANVVHVLGGVWLLTEMVMLGKWMQIGLICIMFLMRPWSRIIFSAAPPETVRFRRNAFSNVYHFHFNKDTFQTTSDILQTKLDTFHSKQDIFHFKSDTFQIKYDTFYSQLFLNVVLFDLESVLFGVENVLIKVEMVYKRICRRMLNIFKSKILHITFLKFAVILC